MSLLRLQNGKPNHLTYIIGASLLLWAALITSSFYIVNGAQRISILAAKIEFGVHAVTLILLMQILWMVSPKDRKPIAWLLAICVWLFFVDLFFYIAAYANNTYLLHMSLIQFFLYYAPCIMYCFIMIAFLSKILLKEVLHVRGYLKILSALLLINIVTIFLFLTSIHYASGAVSWQNICQMAMLGIELILFDFAILGLVYADNSSVFLLLSGTIILITGDFFLTYSSISQTVSLFSYGELFWLLGLLFILFSIISIKQNQHYSIQSWFRKSNMIKSRLAIWAVGTSVSGFLLFFVIAYTFSIVSKQVFIGLPLFAMLYSIIAVTLSILMGKNFETPFSKLTNNIKLFMANHDKSTLDKDFSIEEFVFLNQFVIEAFEAIEEKDKATKKLAETAVQVAHDIRSPLASANSCLASLPQIPEQQRILLRNAMNRINDIANNLLAKHKGGDAAAASYRVWLVAPLVESIISEKRAQFENGPLLLNSEITSKGFAAFAHFDGVEMKRLLSNLINNAAEAFAGKEGAAGNITVVLDADDQYLFLSVKDNGCGIPADKLSAVLEPGVTLKKNGNGLGLPHAKKTAEDWGGGLELTSVVGEGTRVKITLLRAQAPAWFVSSIEVSEDRIIGILDDDASIHGAWDQRLQAVSSTLKVFHFRTSQDFIAWYRGQEGEIQVFSDYELLGDAMTGLEVLEALELGSNALLVTSHYENPEIMARCQKRGIRLLPKNLLAHVPILKRADAEEKVAAPQLQGLFAALQKNQATANKIEGTPDACLVDAVFIDDDTYNHEFWKWSAEQARKQLLCFTDLAGFEAIEAGLLKTTAIYIDLNLADGVKGLDVAKTLYDRGFSNLHIATGYADFTEADYPFLSSIRDKMPPF